MSRYFYQQKVDDARQNQFHLICLSISKKYDLTLHPKKKSYFVVGIVLLCYLFYQFFNKWFCAFTQFFSQVTAVGINTEWGLLMANISEDNGGETPLQVLNFL